MKGVLLYQRYFTVNHRVTIFSRLGLITYSDLCSPNIPLNWSLCEKLQPLEHTVVDALKGNLRVTTGSMDCNDV
jgi:hypothetical protein